MGQMDQRMGQIEQRINERFDNPETRIDSLETRILAMYVLSTFTLLVIIVYTNFSFLLVGTKIL